MARELWYVALGNLSKPFIAATIHCREDVRGLRKCGWNATLHSQADEPVTSPADVPEVVACKNRPIVFRAVFELVMILRFLLARPKPDFVMFRLTGNLPLAFVLWLARMPFGVELCGAPPCFLKHRPWWGWGHQSSRFLLRHASVVISLTPEMAILAEKLARRSAVIVVTGVGVNAEDYQQAGAPAESAGPGPVLGFLGAVRDDRGLDWVLEAVAELHRRGVGARLVVVGDGPYRGQAGRMAVDLGIAGSVDFKGWVPPGKVAEALGECDLMVALYNHTPELTVGGINPMKVWTSLAVAKPTVLHNPGSSDAYAGIPGVFACPQTVPAEIAGVIAEIWRTHGRAGLARAGMDGREYVVEQVTWLRHAEMMDEAICRTLRDE